MIEAINITKIYKPKRGVPVKALDNISIRFPQTGMVFLLGKSGSGKSTLLNVLGGLDVIDSGQIFIKGQPCENFKQQDYDSYRNAYIGFIFQEYNLLEDFTVGANVALAIELQGRKATDEEVNEILNIVDLEGYGGRHPNELSGGQKQRVAIARALVKHPEIIMADEPTGALDSATGKQVFDTLKELSKSKLVIIVSHDRDFAEQYADRIIELADGHIIADDSKVNTEIKEEKIVEQDDVLFNEKSITVRKGYQLTEKDREMINEYLTKVANDVTINIVSNPKVNKINKDYVFHPTEVEKIETNNDGYKLIKSKLSLRNAFKLGSSGLRYKKFRLVVTIILSCVSFTLFGLSDTIASYNKRDNTIASIYDQGVSYASFLKYEEKTFGDEVYYVETQGLNDDDVAYIHEQTGLNVKGVYNDSYYGYDISSHIPSDSTLFGGGIDSSSFNVFTYYLAGYVEFSSQDVEKYGYELMAGHAPNPGNNEVAISRYTYEMFKEEGFVEYGATSKTTINSASDMINKKLYVNDTLCNIVGIIDTKFDFEQYRSLEDVVTSRSDVIAQYLLYTELQYIQKYSLNSVLFIANDELKNYVDLVSASLFKDTYCYLANLDISNNSQSVNRFTFADAYKGSLYSFDGFNSLNVKNDEVYVSYYQLASLLYNSSFFENYDNVGTFYSNKTTDWYKLFTAFGFNEGISWVNILNYSTYEKFFYGMYLLEHLDDIVKPSYTAEQLSAFANDYAMVVNYVNTNNSLISTPENQAIVKEKKELFVTTFLHDSPFLDKNLLTSLMYKDSANKYACEYSSNSLLDIFNGSIDGYFDVKNALSSSKSRSIYCLACANVASKWYDTNKADFISYFGSLVTSTTDLNDKTTAINAVTDFLFSNLGEATINNSTKMKVMNEIGRIAKIMYDFVNCEDSRSMTFTGYNYLTQKNTQKEFKVAGIVTQPNNFTSAIAIFGSEDFVRTVTNNAQISIYSHIVGAMPTTRSGIASIYDFTETLNGKYCYKLQNSVCYQLDIANAILEGLGSVFLYVGIFFAIFAMIMTSNFIATSVNYKKHDIGILRAIGSRRLDVFMIFFAESFIIACINYVLSTIFTVSICASINNALGTSLGIKITLMAFGIRQILVLLLICVGIAGLATLLPVYRHSSKRPIDAIRNR